LPVIEKGESRNLREIAPLRTSELRKRLLALAHDRGVDGLAEVLLEAIGRVGAVDDHVGSRLFREPGLLESRLPHVGEAHLRKVVEVVLVDGDELGPEAFEIAAELRRPRRQHGVGERDLMTFFAKARGGIESPERWVRLAVRRLLRIELELIRGRQRTLRREYRNPHREFVRLGVPPDSLAQRRVASEHFHDLILDVEWQIGHLRLGEPGVVVESR
jgi:hypothetical protein